jgi:phospholipid/cholesterol/gamma-HCH transport system ATP-binding protein
MIEFRNVKKQFGTREILKGISFQIREGEIVFFLGTSGTGKSVSLKILVGLLQATSGEVWVDGENITHYGEQELFRIRKKCGMVFQHPALFDSMSVYENVAFGMRKHTDWVEDKIQDQVDRCLSLVHVKGVNQKLPPELSYGTQKRISLARTVAIEPKVLLFDEPTTGLDPVTTSAVNKLIQDLSRKLKTTSLVVSHDMKCALDIADRIIVLDQGYIVDQGTPDEIMKSTQPLVKAFMAEVLEEMAK